MDAVIVTHLHLGHFDGVAKEVIPKDLKLFTQDEKEAEELRKYGFQDVKALQEDGISFEGIHLTKTQAEHGKAES